MKYLVKFTDSTIENVILNICIFLFGINFLYKNNYVVIGTFALLFVFKKLKIKWGNIPTLVVLILFAISWIVFSPDHELSGICLPICYLIGANIDESDTKGIVKLILLLSFSLAIYTTTFFINYVIHNGITASYHYLQQRNIWNGKALWPTNIMLFSSLFYACFGYIVLNEKDKVIKALYFVVFLLNSYYTVMLSKRAPLLMFILSIGICFVYKLFFEDGKNRKKAIKVLLSIIIFSISLLAIAVVLYKTNAFKFRENIMKTQLYFRYIKDSNYLLLFNDMGRTKIRKEFLSYFWQYPLGGSYIRELIGNYAHDLWLDAYDVAGMAALVLIVAYTILLTIKFIKVGFNKKTSNDIRMLSLCLLVCIFAQFSIEPIMEACKSYMYAVCMIHGSLTLIGEKKND